MGLLRLSELTSLAEATDMTTIPSIMKKSAIIYLRIFSPLGGTF
jgi:hypothetical protein